MKYSRELGKTVKVKLNYVYKSVTVESKIKSDSICL